MSGSKFQATKACYGASDGSLLIRERVSTYAELNGSLPSVNGYSPDSAWTGDQGLILGGMIDKVALDPTDPRSPTYQAQALAITDGMLLHLVDGCGVTSYSDGFDSHQDPDDYSCGSGVFWRYLLHAFDENPKVHSAVLGLVADDPDGNAVYVSAQQATAPTCTSDNQLFAGFNTLATLLSAIEVLEAAS